LIIALDADEYANALEDSASMGVVGGGICDALRSAVRHKAEAKAIYTWNTRPLCPVRAGSDQTAANALGNLCL
jgi:hypothetical protein